MACKSTYKQRFHVLAETRANVLFILIMSCGANKIFSPPDLLQLRLSFSTVTTSRWTPTGASSLPGYHPVGGRGGNGASGRTKQHVLACSSATRALTKSSGSRKTSCLPSSIPDTALALARHIGMTGETPVRAEETVRGST